MSLQPTDLIVLYLATLIIFLGIDFVWLRLVVLDIFEARIGDMMRDQPKIAVAGGFYAFYVMGILFFCSAGIGADTSLWTVFGRGVVLGLMAYGTYEFTSMSVMKNWDWTMVSMDTAWGGFLTGISAVGGLVVARWIL
ncbi:DUF2177 family protein [Roseobacter sp. HKCCA0434]|uniref:DUF2177 family protein n=1 Tax=Roseobacter sp. HKCCA0434 TaxID=3079297 RepID=UPI002905AC03|nr:DUF2177 family protein [Roseobacter sp. HKCCA0434]